MLRRCQIPNEKLVPRQLKEVKHSRIPHLLQIETTYACNSHCLFCYNPNRDSTIDYKTLDKIVDSVSRAKIPHVYLIGGEPSLLKVSKLNEYINKLSEHSSVTIVTNGRIYLQGISEKLACFGVALHGNEKTHEMLTTMKGTYKKILSNIRKYVADGFDVRCIPVLCAQNYNQMYDLVKFSKELGMNMVFVDRFEEGGLGSEKASQLKPTMQEFKVALTQMIKARDDFGIPVGFGTAIPFCLDERLITEKMASDCGAGTTFAAVSPKGDLRICNQSPIIYGNVLEEPVEEIWNKKEIDEFRDLRWVTEPCKSCPILHQCLCGCKVDISCSDKFCVDYAIRGLKKPPVPIRSFKRKEIIHTYPSEYRRFKINRYTKLNLCKGENYLVTRYQTILIDDLTISVLETIIDGVDSEEKLIKLFSKKLSKKEVRHLVSLFLKAGAIDILPEVIGHV